MIPLRFKRISFAGNTRVSSAVVRRIAFAAALITVLATPATAATCTALAGLALPDTTILTAQVISGGTFGGESNLPEFCRVTATLTPTTDSSINIEVWMPSSNWNGRFEGVGGGGYQGAVRYDEMAPALQQGYAVANTDEGTGTSGCNSLFCGDAGNQGNALAAALGETATPSSGLFGHPERIKDFGYRAIHLMTVRSKQILKAFYQRSAERAYFSGCSTGGQNALMEAQRFPGDYDGILAGAPAHNRTHLHTVPVWDWQNVTATADSFVSPAQLTLVNNAVLAQCAGQDGGLKSDGFLTDPRDCHFDPTVLQCMGSTSPPDCLTTSQVSVFKRYYSGPLDPRTGELIYPGNARGSEASSFDDLGLALNELLPEPAFDGLFYWVFGASFGDLNSAQNYRNFDFDRGVAAVDQALAADLNATSTDLEAFAGRGGKLLMYHGWADPLIPSQGSINYFNAVVTAQTDVVAQSVDVQERTRAFFRLFMAPGMYHCTGGPGPNVFGGVLNQGGLNDPGHNALSALVKWVEQGVAPETIIATKFVNDVPAQGVVMQRPLCVFPKVARYNGMGDPTLADSFVCVTDEQDTNQVPAPQFGP